MTTHRPGGPLVAAARGRGRRAPAAAASERVPRPPASRHRVGPTCPWCWSTAARARSRPRSRPTASRPRPCCSAGQHLAGDRAGRALRHGRGAAVGQRLRERSDRRRRASPTSGDSPRSWARRSGRLPSGSSRSPPGMIGPRYPMDKLEPAIERLLPERPGHRRRRVRGGRGGAPDDRLHGQVGDRPPRAARRRRLARAGDGVGGRQGRGHDPPADGHDAGLRAHRRGGRARRCCPRMLRPIVARTWDQLTVDGDTSTSDTVFLVASGRRGCGRRVAPGADGWEALSRRRSRRCAGRSRASRPRTARARRPSSRAR